MGASRREKESLAHGGKDDCYGGIPSGLPTGTPISGGEESHDQRVSRTCLLAKTVGGLLHCPPCRWCWASLGLSAGLALNQGGESTHGFCTFGVLGSLTSMGTGNRGWKQEKARSPGFKALSLHLLDRMVGKVVQLSEPVVSSQTRKDNERCVV